MVRHNIVTISLHVILSEDMTKTKLNTLNSRFTVVGLYCKPKVKKECKR